MKGSLIIIGFFILGTLCGFFHLIPFDLSVSISLTYLSGRLLPGVIIL